MSTAIHKEIDFKKASPQRVYEALLDAKQFSAFTELRGETPNFRRVEFGVCPYIFKRTTKPSPTQTFTDKADGPSRTVSPEYPQFSGYQR